MKPIKPSEVGAQKAKSYPPEVFEAFNEMIARNFVNGQARFDQKDVIALIKEKFGENTDDFTGSSRFKIDYLNVETAYEQQGWEVEYDRPAYYENYNANFTFTEC